MAQTARRFPALAQNADGKAHPVQNAFAAVTIVLGLLAFISAWWPDLHMISTWAGLFGLLTGAWGQMISVTTAERFVLVIGLGAAGVGFFLGMANGGFLPG